MAHGTGTNKGKILVVDDDRLVLATLSHGLTQAGYEVIDADNGDDAILAAHEHRPRLALLDIRMEGKSGFDVAAYLREHLHTPFMFLSAFTDEDTVRQVKALGAVAYLVKPLDIHRIVPAVEAAFAQLPAPTATAAPRAVAAALSEHVAMAVGVLMHRYSLNRHQSLAQLERLAHQEGRSLDDQAGRVLDAVEGLALPSTDG